MNESCSIYSVYSVYDSLCEKYGQPFLAENDAVAARRFRGWYDSLPADSRTGMYLHWIGDFNQLQQESHVQLIAGVARELRLD